MKKWPPLLPVLALLGATLANGGEAGGQDGSGSVVFNRDIAPLVYQHCGACHRPGGSGPFSLLTYGDARRRARQIATVTQTGFMPPWQPKAGYGEFAGERRLSAEEKERIRLWVEGGTPRGEGPEPTPPQWTEGWQGGEPDLVARLPEPYTVPAEGTDVFRNFIIPIPVDGPRWVKAVELRPGNPRLVHHAVMQIAEPEVAARLDARDPAPGFPGMDMGDSTTPDGQILSWTPGKGRPSCGDGLSWKLEPNRRLILQLHMAPTGVAETIQPEVGFFFADSPPKVSAEAFVLHAKDIDIPPGKKDYRVTDSVTFPVDVQLLSLYPHAHYVAKDMKVYALLPGGEKRWLLWIPDWDFNWQDQYWFRSPVRLPAASRVVMEYTYDNSADNVRNPNNPPKRVVEGPRSSDEMGSLAIQTTPVDPEDFPLLHEALLRQVASEPGNSRAWIAHLHLGQIREREGRRGEAVDHYLKSIRARPDDPQSHFFLASARQKQGRYREAESEYRKAYQLNPGSVEVCNNLGALLGGLGRLEEAAVFFERALELDPDNPELHLNLGNALGKNVGEALGHYRRALQLRPDYAEAHNSLGVALASLGEFEEALRHFQRAVELRPADAGYRENLETVKQRLGSN